MSAGGDRRRPGKGHFSDELDGVVPLRDRNRRRAPPRGNPTSGPAQSPAPEFELSDTGSGRARDVGAKTLAELRRGRPPAEREIDLHGLDKSNARDELRAGIEAARADGFRCVLVIHGRGQHSKSGPVLQTAVPGWLSSEPLSHAVMAFTRAPAGHGGATLVRLRRAR